MKLKQSLPILFSLFIMLLSANSYAGRQGVNGYYGVGLGAASTKNADVAGTGAVIVGIEEDGWALEAIGFASVEAGTDNSNLDYSINGVDIGLGYRTIEKNNMYYFLKFSKTDIDVKYKLTNDITSTTTTSTNGTDGNSFTVGMGFRMARDARLEVNYTYYSSDSEYGESAGSLEGDKILPDPVHMISVQYLWGGAPYHGSSF